MLWPLPFWFTTLHLIDQLEQLGFAENADFISICYSWACWRSLETGIVNHLDRDTAARARDVLDGHRWRGAHEFPVDGVWAHHKIKAYWREQQGWGPLVKMFLVSDVVTKNSDTAIQPH